MKEFADTLLNCRVSHCPAVAGNVATAYLFTWPIEMAWACPSAVRLVVLSTSLAIMPLGVTISGVLLCAEPYGGVTDTSSEPVLLETVKLSCVSLLGVTVV